MIELFLYFSSYDRMIIFFVHLEDDLGIFFTKIRDSYYIFVYYKKL